MCTASPYTTARVKCCWNDCNMEFNNDRKCLLHLRATHDLKGAVCYWNDCHFRSAGLGIRNHVKRHFHIIEAFCTICEEVVSFKWRFDLNKHLIQFHKRDAFEINQVKEDGFDIHIAKRASLSPSLARILN